MKLNRESKLTLAAVAMIVVVATTIAAVPGIFSTVDSVNGYTVNGSAGSAGQSLCSDGTRFNTPCSGAVPKYQTMQSNGGDEPQEPKLNFSTAFTITDSAGTSTNVALTAPTITTTSTAGTITGGGGGCDNSSFTASGNYFVLNGIYYQHIRGKTQTDCASSPNNGAENIVLPHSCPTGILSSSVTNYAPVLDTDDTHQGSQSLVSISTTTIVTQRYRSADHGGSDSAPDIQIVCH